MQYFYSYASTVWKALSCWDASSPKTNIQHFKILNYFTSFLFFLLQFCLPGSGITIRTRILLNPGFETPAYFCFLRSSLKARINKTNKTNIQHFKIWNYFTSLLFFLRQFCLPGSGITIRIRILLNPSLETHQLIFVFTQQLKKPVSSSSSLYVAVADFADDKIALALSCAGLSRLGHRLAGLAGPGRCRLAQRAAAGRRLARQRRDGDARRIAAYALLTLHRKENPSWNKKMEYNTVGAEE